MASTLYILGMPLDDHETVTSKAATVIEQAALVVGENRKQSLRYTRDLRLPENIFFLDPPRPTLLEDIYTALNDAKKAGQDAVLFSDSGMPILFDPGREVLERAKQLGFEIRTIPMATSWGTACAVSGWPAPFLVVGYLDRDTEKRKEQLKAFKQLEAHAVLFDTPYRFKSLMASLIQTLGAGRHAFLAWEIARPQENYLWGTLAQLEKEAVKKGIDKGEFILILKGTGSAKKPR